MKTKTTVTGELSQAEVLDAIRTWIDQTIDHTIPDEDMRVVLNQDGSASFSYEIKKDNA